MFKNWILAIVLYALAPPGVCGERFSGSGKLTEANSGAKTSARFRLHADLSAAPLRSTQKAGSESTSPPTQAAEMSNGRFALSARFSDAMAGSVCGLPPTEILFVNGFEN